MRKQMVKLATIVDIAKKGNIDGEFKDLEAYTTMYETGMNKVLCEIAESILKKKDGFDVENSKAYQDQRDKVNKIREQIERKFKSENNRKLAFDLDSELGTLLLYVLDGAFIEGFQAGYRFLKELKPD